MKIGIVSDIHGNLWALNAVLQHMDEQGVDSKACLGDTVGYGPYPNECIEAVVANFNFILMGNHDNAVFDKEELASFNRMARYGVEFTEKKITPSNLEILKNLEYGYVTEEKIMFVHGAPNAVFHYLLTESDAINAFANPVSDFNIAFVGHTHTPAVWERTGAYEAEYIRPRYSNNIMDEVAKFEHYTGYEQTIVNVGSVGQSRDGDKRASYAIFDTEHNHLTMYKVPYSVDKTIAKMQSLSFPPELWSRLMYGR